MITVEGVEKASIRSHYQLGTLFYRLLWGPHLHHGLWNADESADVAQCQLTDTLADMAQITGLESGIDIGCGIGGSTIRLAKQRGCDVTGVTLSPLQRHWAVMAARWHGVRQTTRFLAADAESIEFADRSFDFVWSVECTEHLFNKPAFVSRASGWLRPGGRMAICAWLEGSDTSRNGHREQVEQVCRRFVCPSFATRQEYVQWMIDSGMRITHDVDWTDRVMRTWEICQRRVARLGVRRLAQVLDRKQVEFLDGFETLLAAYRCGAMEYGAIIGEKT